MSACQPGAAERASRIGGRRGRARAAIRAGRVDDLGRGGGRPGDGNIRARRRKRRRAGPLTAVRAGRIGRRRGGAAHAISACGIYDVSSGASLVVVTRRGAVRIERHDFVYLGYAQQTRAVNPLYHSNFRESTANRAFCGTLYQSMAPPFSLPSLKNAPRRRDQRHGGASGYFVP